MKMQHHSRLLPAVSTLLSVLAHKWQSLAFLSVLSLHSTWEGCCGRGRCQALGGIAMGVVFIGLERWRPLQGNHGPLLGGLDGYSEGGWTHLSSQYRELSIRKGETKAGECQKSNIWFIYDYLHCSLISVMRHLCQGIEEENLTTPLWQKTYIGKALLSDPRANTFRISQIIIWWHLTKLLWLVLGAG